VRRVGTLLSVAQMLAARPHNLELDGCTHDMPKRIEHKQANHHD